MYFTGVCVKRLTVKWRRRMMVIWGTLIPFKRKKTNYLLGIVHSREFHNSREIHRRITQDAPSNSFSKDHEKSQPQPQKKGLLSLIQATRIELFYQK